MEGTTSNISYASNFKIFLDPALDQKLLRQGISNPLAHVENVLLNEIKIDKYLERVLAMLNMDLGGITIPLLKKPLSGEYLIWVKEMHQTDAMITECYYRTLIN